MKAINNVNTLLMQTIGVVRSSIEDLHKYNKDYLDKYSYHSDLQREMKGNVDIVMDEIILNRLSRLNIPILSEESGIDLLDADSSLRFVVDPLDGTVNFVRGISLATVSIALYDGNNPVFGVIGIVSTREVAWGGRGIGAFIDQEEITVSKITLYEHSVLCTGFPSRFSMDNDAAMVTHCNIMKLFGKVRMLGAASISLLNVAKGSAECYFENDIMIWDVAAGLALVEGAGGVVSFSPGNYNDSLNVIVTNGKLNVSKWSFI